METPIIVEDKAGYLKMFQDSYATDLEEIYYERENPPSKLTWVADNIFCYKTYEDALGEDLCKEALWVCQAINLSGDHSALKSHCWTYADRKTFITHINMPFFTNKIEWGTSIRYPWWCGLGEDGFLVRMSCAYFTYNGVEIEGEVLIGDFKKFIEALLEFVSDEFVPVQKPREEQNGYRN